MSVKWEIDEAIIRRLKNELSADKREQLIVDYFTNSSITVSDYIDLMGKYVIPYRQIRSVVVDSRDFIGLPTIEEKKCDCGAKHTSFPQHHYKWCKVKS